MAEPSFLEARIIILERLVLDATSTEARIAVLESQVIAQRENTAIALAAVDKATDNARLVAEKAVAKVELAAEKTYLEAAIKSLREAFTQQIAFQKELSTAALAAADKAVAKAEDAATRRFESVNEFRATLADQQRDLATKSEVNLRFIAVEGRINTVVEDAREIKGKSIGMNAGWGLLVGVIGVVAAVAIVFVDLYHK